MNRSVRGRAPPGIKRGPGRGLAENNIGNGNALTNNAPRDALQSRRASEARRLFRQRRCWGASSVLDSEFDELPNAETWRPVADIIAEIIAGLGECTVRGDQ